LISYPLYLWHWPLFSFAYILRSGKPPTPLMSAGLILLSFLSAIATYRLVERPIRTGPARYTRIITACMVVIGLCGLATWQGDGFPQRFRGLDLKKISDARSDADFMPTRGMKVSNHNHTLVAQIGAGERRVVFGGDSVLFHYGPRVQQIADDGRLASSVYFVAGGSCAPVPGVIQRDHFAHCSNLPEILTDLVRRENVQSVVLGASWIGYHSSGMRIEREGLRLRLDTPEGQDVFYRNLEDFVGALQALGAKVYLILGVPSHGRFHPGGMVTRGMTGISVAPGSGEPVSIAALRDAHAAPDARLREIAERTGAQSLDPFPDICGSQADCSPFFSEGIPKFSDGMHLRPIFVKDHLRFIDFLLK
jgi:hypothetical protein